MNFNLLTILSDAKVVVDLTSKSTTTSSCVIAVPAPVATVPALNLTQGVGTYYLDMLIEEGKKDEGRQKKFEAIKKEQKTNQQKIENPKKITKVSSAQLASRNHYVLDENVQDLVFARNAAIEAAQAATEQRKRSAELKKAETLNKALEKFIASPNGLTVPDIKALVAAVSKSSDSPVKKKKEELLEQLYCEP